MKTWRSTFFWIIVIAWTIPAGAQDLEKAERFGLELERVVDQERYSLDSLSVLLESNARRIEAEKRKTNPDRSLLMQWMSDGVVLAQKIRDQQNRVDRIEQEWVILQKQLHQAYTARIDSLSRMTTQLASKEKINEIEKQIWEFSQKRILCSPAVRRLSFDTRVINSISLSGQTDSLERAILLDYLEKAQTEVAARLGEVRQKRREYASVLRLQEKLENFVEEISEQGYLPISRRPGGTLPPGFVYVDERYWSNQMRSLSNLLQQLNIRGNLVGRVVFSGGAASVEEYLELLAETEKQLADYQKFIRNKLQ